MSLSGLAQPGSARPGPPCLALAQARGPGLDRKLCRPPLRAGSVPLLRLHRAASYPGRDLPFSITLLHPRYPLYRLRVYLNERDRKSQ